jgi:beta-1,4-mannosyltransferase
MQVLMMPDYRCDNPYQTLLSNALEQEGVIVSFPEGYRRIFPIYRAVQSSVEPISVLHLHWLDPYLKGGTLFIKFCYCIKFLLDILWVRATGIRVIWTVHNVVSHNAKYPRLEKLTQQGLSWLVHNVIVHHSSAVQEVAQQYGLNPAKITAIPHGHYRDIYEPAISPAAARQKLGLPDTGRVYLNLGMLKPYKGLERLIQIWKDNQDALQGNTLLIAGQALDEDYGKCLEKQAFSMGNIILHNTRVEDNQIHLYFSAADVIVLPFERILTSGSLILAMSYSCPIIAPRIGSIPETLATADLLLYAEAQGLLHTIMKSTQVDLMTLRQVVTQVCDRLDWGKIANKTHQLYQSEL